MSYGGYMGRKKMPKKKPPARRKKHPKPHPVDNEVPPLNIKESAICCKP